QSFRGILLMPAPVPGVVVNAVNSAEGPEVQGNNPATQALQGERFRVDPGFDIPHLRGAYGRFPYALEIKRLANHGRPHPALLVSQHRGSLRIRAGLNASRLTRAVLLLAGFDFLLQLTQLLLRGFLDLVELSPLFGCQ